MQTLLFFELYVLIFLIIEINYYQKTQHTKNQHKKLSQNIQNNCINILSDFSYNFSFQFPRKLCAMVQEFGDSYRESM